MRPAKAQAAAVTFIRRVMDNFGTSEAMASFLEVPEFVDQDAHPDVEQLEAAIEGLLADLDPKKADRLAELELRTLAYVHAMHEFTGALGAVLPVAKVMREGGHIEPNGQDPWVFVDDILRGRSVPALEDMGTALSTRSRRRLRALADKAKGVK